ncbi:MAG: hypothetical protein ACYDAY_04180 [Candidatus Dormibacteria bacterium]
MNATFMRRARVAVAVVTAGVVLAACGTQGAAVSSTSSPNPSASPQARRGGASGQLVQVTGQTLILSGPNGDTTVNFTASTTITKTSNATLADIVAGMCIVATGSKDATGAITATNVRIAAMTAGVCVTPAGGPGGGAGRTGTPRPGFTPRPNATPGGSGGPPANFGSASGSVTTVAGTAVTVQPAAGSATTVTVPSTATVSRSQAGSVSDLVTGECVTAAGQPDASGAIQATALIISPPTASGTCNVGRGGRGGGFGGGAGGGTNG